MPRQHWVIACAAVAALSGCTSETTTTEDYVLPKGESLGELRQQASHALARYEEAVAKADSAGQAIVTPPSWDPSVGGAGTAVESAQVTPAGTRLTVTFTGSRDPAVLPCGIDYSAEVVESAHAVAVIVIAQHHGGDGAGDRICTMAGFTRTATVNLARPLNGRSVLEVREGQPVPVSIGIVTE